MIAVIVALKKEISNLKEAATEVKEASACGMDYILCRLAGKEAVVIKCGVGKAAAAAAATLAIGVLRADAVISTGIAAGLYDAGTVMLADRLVQHDFDMTADGLRPGVMPGRENCYFSADPAMTDKMAEALGGSGIPFERCIIASGDVFVADKRRMKQITSDFDAGGVDMESGAVAQVCTAAKVPFAVLRCVSDNGDNVEDYYAFALKACDNFTLALMKYFSAQ